MTSREKIKQIRAEQDALEQIADEVRVRVGQNAWTEILRRNQHESVQRGEKLEFYRDAEGLAQYQFRAASEVELSARAEEWAEDNI